MNMLYISIDLTAKQCEKDDTYELLAQTSVWKYRKFTAMLKWPLATLCMTLKPELGQGPKRDSPKRQFGKIPHFEALASLFGHLIIMLIDM